MEVFRITRLSYATKLTASGGPARWNLAGQYVLYTGSSRSLATLELVVRRNSISPAIDYKVMILSVADDDRLIKQIQTKELPSDWRQPTIYSTSQSIGSDWYTKKESLVLKVPSAVIIQEYNYIINTEHPDFKANIKLVRTENYFWDSRLL